MAILYALVARGTIVLAEFSAASGNAGTIARRLLEKLLLSSPSPISSSSSPAPIDSSHLSFSQDRHIFHIFRSPEDLSFLCMANDAFGSKWYLFFAFDYSFSLSHIHTHTRARACIPKHLNLTVWMYRTPTCIPKHINLTVWMVEDLGFCEFILCSLNILLAEFEEKWYHLEIGVFVLVLVLRGVLVFFNLGILFEI